MTMAVVIVGFLLISTVVLASGVMARRWPPGGVAQVSSNVAVTITNPEENDVVSDTILVRGTASCRQRYFRAYHLRNYVTQVKVKIDDGEWERAIGTTSWKYEWDTTTVNDGTHTIYAKANGVVDTVQVTVDNGADGQEKSNDPIPPVWFAWRFLKPKMFASLLSRDNYPFIR